MVRVLEVSKLYGTLITSVFIFIYYYLVRIHLVITKV